MSATDHRTAVSCVSAQPNTGALGEGFVTAWGRIHVDLCRLTGSICLG